MEKIIEKLKNERILALIGLGGLLLGIFLPYFTIKILTPSYSVSLFKFIEGKLILVLIIINAMFIFKDYLKQYVPQIFESSFGRKIENANPKLSIIPIIIIVILILYLTFGGEFQSKYVGHGLGFWLSWIGIVALIAHSFIYKGIIIENNSNTTNATQSVEIQKSQTAITENVGSTTSNVESQVISNQNINQTYTNNQDNTQNFNQ